MPDPASLLLSLRAQGFALRAEGGRLVVSPASRLGPALERQLRHSSGSLQVLLRREQEDLDAVLDYVRTHDTLPPVEG